MTAIEQAEQFYAKTGASFYNDIAHHMKHGYIHITPEYVLWGHAVCREAGLPEKQQDVKDPDAWYIRFACGINWMHHFFRLIPYHLPYIGWARWEKKRPVQYFETETLTRKIQNGI